MMSYVLDFGAVLGRSWGPRSFQVGPRGLRKFQTLRGRRSRVSNTGSGYPGVPGFPGPGAGPGTQVPGPAPGPGNL